jgi:translation initiation factor 4G
VKSILNKMTKEKFDKLSDQMCEIKIVSHEMLTMMINHIYEKAICEPSFSEMYAELCVKLSLTAKKSIFVRIIESDEEPPTDDGLSELHGNQGGSSGNPVYRWSNDVNTDDSEIMGPFESPEECVNCAVDAENSPDPFPRKEIELELHALKIHRGMFIKIMHAKNDPSTFYTVFFPMNKVVEVGQQLSKDLFLSELECLKDGNKKNNFKRILLYKCEDEFNKKGIYENWKIEKKKHEDNKSSLSDSERLEKESELEFRRMKLKKQMLGNIKFIGELYKKDMLKEKIMHYCIQQLLKIEENSNGDLSLIKDDEMDEEDHEALCNLFASIGRQIDNVLSRSQMHFYFKRIAALSTEKTLSSRSRFMYKDLLELKENKWKARREEETAKTLDEIKKDFEKEERLAAQQSQQSQMQSRPVPANLARNTSSGSRGSVRGGINKGVPNYGEVKDDSRRDHSDPHFRQKPVKDSRDIRSFNRTEDVPPPQILTRSASGNVPPKSSGPSVKPAPSIAEEKKKSIPPEEIIQRKAQSMRTEFIQSRGQVSEDDLIFSFTDITTLPDFGRIFVQKNADFAIDCKAYELDAVISILSLLVSKGRLTPSDFDLPFGELVEFLPDFITDSPSAVQAIGEMIAAFINIKTLSFLWLCELCEKLQNELCAEHFPSLISRIIECLKPKYGDKASLRADLGPYENRLSHLVGESQWNHVIYDEK